MKDQLKLAKYLSRSIMFIIILTIFNLDLSCLWLLAIPLTFRYFLFDQKRYDEQSSNDEKLKERIQKEENYKSLPKVRISF